MRGRNGRLGLTQGLWLSYSEQGYSLRLDLLRGSVVYARTMDCPPPLSAFEKCFITMAFITALTALTVAASQLLGLLG